MGKLLRQILDLNECPKNPVVTIYDRDGIKVASTSKDTEFDYIRLQIAKNRIEGCYLIFNNTKYPISSMGRINSFPKGLFDVCFHLVAEMLQREENVWKERSKLINIDDCPENEFVEVYDNENKLITRTNSDLMFDWVRSQIKQKGLNGCYVLFREKRFDIDENGRIADWPKGLFDTWEYTLATLL